MYKLIYVRDGKRPSGTYRLLAVFDEDHARNLGYDDADYSLLDSFIKGVKQGGDQLLEIEQHLLNDVPLELSRNSGASSHVPPRS